MTRSFYVKIALVLVFAVGAAPLFAGGGQEKETEVGLTKPPAYISPGNAATGHDSLTIDNIKLTIDKNGSIKSYTLNIYNKNGEVIFTTSESKLQGRGFFGDLLNIGDVPQVKIPSSFNWPGKNTAGTVVSDGEYFYQLTVLDSFGKKASSPPLSVVVDTKAPSILTLSYNYRIFSPNGDGVRDTLTFSHKTDAAYTWSEAIAEANGNAVVWKKDTTAPGDTSSSDVVYSSDTVWDGKANQTAGQATSGQVVKEGDYVYTLTGTDRAGNKVSKSLPFVVSFTASDLDASIVGGNPNFGAQNGITFNLKVGDSKGLLSWKVEISDNDGIIYRRFAADGIPPTSLKFSGKGNPGRPENESFFLKDGSYNMLFSALYDSGAESKAEVLKINLDATAPVVDLGLDTDPTATANGQTPNFGAEKRARLLINLRYEPAVTWTVHLNHISQAGTAAQLVDASVDLSLADLLKFARSVSTDDQGGGIVATSYAWDGTLPDTLKTALSKVQGFAAPANTGTVILPDGVWELSMDGKDAAGNATTSKAQRFVKDTLQRSGATITLSDTRLSPGTSSPYSSVKIGFSAAVMSNVQSFVAKIVGNDGNSYYTLTASRWVPEFVWTGKRNNDSDAPDGVYRVQLAVEYQNGASVSGVSDDNIALDRKLPTATVKTNKSSFTPNGDSVDDTITFTQTSSEAKLWTGTLTSSSGQVVKTQTWAGHVADWTWDGLGPDGKALADDLFTYELSAKNDAGNSGGAKVTGIRIDNLSESVRIKVADPVISPNNDGFLDSTNILPTIALMDQLRGWEINVSREDGKFTKTFQGGTSLPSAIAWNGSNDQGSTEDGVYRVDFVVEYKNGAKTSRQASDPIVVVKNPPVGKVSTDADLFSPDGDGVRDTVTILLDARATERPIDNWKVEILDPASHGFRSWGGTGVPPASIVWDGKSESGEIAQSASDYTILFTLQDSVKNTHRSMATVSIDILVFKDGNRLRIALPSIQFAGNSSDLFSNAQATVDKNLDTLRRLARILNRYPDYTISVEGHATFVWSKTAAEQSREQNDELLPLSRARALEVKQALTILGVKWERMNSVGYGGSRPVVPHTDLDNKWKNRRVEFILEKQ